MSDVVRNYTGKYGSIHRARHRRRHPRRLGVKFLCLLILTAVVAYEYWNISDRVPLELYIPANREYVIFVNDLLEKRTELASSTVWRALPESLNLAWVPERLNGALDLPAWVQNNIVGPTCCIAGNDMDSFSDEIFVTKATWIGSLLGDLYPILPHTRRVPGGAWGLRYWEKGGKYFTFEGRILIASPSREALLAFLKEHRTFTGLETGPENFRGAIDLSTGQTNPLSKAFDSIRFAVQVEPTRARITYRAKLKEPWRQALEPMLRNASRNTLVTPPPGMASLSANFGLPMADVWRTLAAEASASEIPLLDHCKKLWELAPPPAGQMTSTLLGQAGPGFEVSFTGFDMDEVVPVPEFLGVFDTDYLSLDTAFAALSDTPAQTAPWESFPHYDAEARRAHLPMLGGPSLEPTAAIHGSRLVASTSKRGADALLAQSPDAADLPNPAMLYLHIYPYQCADALLAAGERLSQDGLLRDSAETALAERATSWRSTTSGILELEFSAYYEQQEMVGELNLKCGPTQ